jgi:hypothetical protein
MSNDFFNASGTPAQASSIVSPNVRAEFAAIAAGFDKLPTLTGNAYKVTYINASGSAMASVGGDGLLKISTTGVPTVAAVGTDYTNLAVLSAATAATPNDADLMPVVDAGVTKKLSLTNLKAFLKTYFDTIYAALAGSVSQAFAALTIDLGHASDTTLTRASAGVLAVEGVVVPSISSTNTLTNKRVTPRVGSTTSSATPTINTDNVDIYKITAQTEAITSMTTNLSGTPTDGDVLIIQITGTAARAITWGASFEASTVALPTTTVTTAMLSVGFLWNSVTSKWRCMAAV